MLTFLLANGADRKLPMCLLGKTKVPLDMARATLKRRRETLADYEKSSATPESTAESFLFQDAPEEQVQQTLADARAEVAMAEAFVAALQ